MFKKAERKKAYLKIAMCGVSGSGKTYSALQLARGLGNNIAMIDTENGSGELYSDLCSYDICSISAPFEHTKYIKAIKEAEADGYDVLIIDSLTQAWNGAGGLLEKQEQLARTKWKGNSWAAWRDITPMHEQLVQAILQSKIHVIATMRSKQEYIQTDDKKIKKVGMAPQQREGMDYEFTIVFDIDRDNHEASASKDRTGLFDNKIGIITPETGKMIKDWCESGAMPRAEKLAEPAEAAVEAPKPRVLIGEDYCKVLTSNGYKDVTELEVEQLQQLVNLKSYADAKPFIQAVLAHKAMQEKQQVNTPTVSEEPAEAQKPAPAAVETKPLQDAPNDDEQAVLDAFFGEGQ